MYATSATVETVETIATAPEPVTQRVTLARVELLAALKVLAPICKQRNVNATLPVLACVYIANGRISATDLHIGVSYAITTWPPVSDAAMCLDAASLLKLCQSSKADSVTISVETGWHKAPNGTTYVADDHVRATVMVGAASIGVSAFSADEFPIIPSTAEFAPFATIPAAALHTMLTRALPFASTDTTRGPCTYVHLTATPGYLTAAATDAYRLAIVSMPAVTTAESSSPLNEPARAPILPTLNMPAASVARWLKAFSAKSLGDTVITVAAKRGQYAVTCGAVEIIGQIGSEQYVNFRQILPKSPRVVISCNAAELLAAVNMVFSRDGSNLVTLAGDSNGVRVCGELDNRQSVVMVCGQGCGGPIGFNRDYLVNILAPMGKLNVHMLQTGTGDGLIQPTHAATFRAASDTMHGMSGTYVVMPVTVPR